LWRPKRRRSRFRYYSDDAQVMNCDDSARKLP
jgi:hypothetical protein